MKIFILTIGMAFVVSFSSSMSDVTITELLIGPKFENWILIKTSGTKSQCDSNYDYVTKIDDTEDPGDKLLYATLLTAYTTKSKIQIKGTDNCRTPAGATGSYESLNSIKLQ